MASTDVQTYVARVSPTVTVTASSAYTARNSVGGLLTITGASRRDSTPGIIQSVTVTFKATQTSPFEVWFFNANPTSSTITDKTAFNVHNSDFAKLVGVVACNDVFQCGTGTIMQAIDVVMPYSLSTGTDLYAALVCTSTPTFTSTTDVGIGIRVVQL